MTEMLLRMPSRRKDLDRVIAQLPASDNGFLRPIFTAVRDCGVSFAIVSQKSGRFSLPLDKPTIAIFADDPGETPGALGPAAFHSGSVRRLLAKISSIVLISGGAEERFYSCAAVPAMIFRQHVLVVETRPRFEADWANLIERQRPGLPTLLCTPPGEGGVQ
jgi:hypothetical protein